MILIGVGVVVRLNEGIIRSGPVRATEPVSSATTSTVLGGTYRRNTSVDIGRYGHMTPSARETHC